jgi:hypothetical protein
LKKICKSNHVSCVQSLQFFLSDLDQSLKSSRFCMSWMSVMSMFSWFSFISTLFCHPGHLSASRTHQLHCILGDFTFVLPSAWKVFVQIAMSPFLYSSNIIFLV